MKKIILAFLLIALLLSATACSTTKDEKYYAGKWEVASLEKNGVIMSVKELEELGNYNVSNFGIILKENGDAYFYYSNNSKLGEWSLSDNGIVMGGNVLTLVKNQLKWVESNSGEIYYFEKISDSQKFPNENQTSSGVTSTGEIRSEFKAAMDSYEAFYNEYFQILKQYKENPANISILSKYMELMGKLSDMDAKFKAWKNNSLNDAELKYYLEVNSRISKKLLEFAG